MVLKNPTLILKQIDFTTNLFTNRIMVGYFVEKCALVIHNIQIPTSRTHKPDLFRELQEKVLFEWIQSQKYGVKLVTSPDKSLF